MRLIFLLFTMLFSFFTYPEGFSNDTKVLTNNGYVAIESIRSGDSIICFDEKREFIEGLFLEFQNVQKSLLLFYLLDRKKLLQ